MSTHVLTVADIRVKMNRPLTTSNRDGWVQHYYADSIVEECTLKIPMANGKAGGYLISDSQGRPIPTSFCTILDHESVVERVELAAHSAAAQEAVLD